MSSDVGGGRRRSQSPRSRAPLRLNEEPRDLRNLSPGGRHDRRRSSPADSHRGERSRRRSPIPRDNSSRRHYGGDLRYADALSAGLDEDLDAEPYALEGRRWRRSRSRSRERNRGRVSSKFIRAKGLPGDADEGKVRALFAPIPGLIRLTLERDDEDLASCCSALLEMAAPPAADALMASGWRSGAHFGDHRLSLEYARAPSPVLGILDASDWICAACRCMNYARRRACFHCTAPRTTDADAVDTDAPCPVLRVGNLEDDVDEAALEYLCKAYAPVHKVRMVRDKITGAPRGTGFVYFRSVTEAAAVLQGLNGKESGKMGWRFRVSYAHDRIGSSALAENEEEEDAGGGGGGIKRRKSGSGRDGNRGAAADAAGLGGEAGWAPKEFDEAALEAVAGGGGGEASKDGSVQQPLMHSTDGISGGMEYDAASGYMRDLASGMLFDPGTGFHFHPTLQQWGTRDGATGEFLPYQDEMTGAETAAGADAGVGGSAAAKRVKEERKSSRAVSQPAATDTSNSIAAENGERRQQQGLRAQPGFAATAVIGAAPQLNPQALLALAEAQGGAKKVEDAKKKVEDAKKPAAVQGVVRRGKWAQRAKQKQH